MSELSLFPQIKPLHEVEMFYIFPKDRTNETVLFMNRMELATRGQNMHHRWISGNHSLINQDHLFLPYRHFNGNIAFKFNHQVISAFIIKYHMTMSIDSYLHAAATSMQGLYVLYAGEPGKGYVGSVFGEGRSFCDRWKDHIRDLKKGTHHNQRLQKVYNKHRLLIPMILYATNSNYHNSKETQLDILAGEKVAINKLWENNYNKRKF